MSLVFPQCGVMARARIITHGSDLRYALAVSPPAALPCVPAKHLLRALCLYILARGDVGCRRCGFAKLDLLEGLAGGRVFREIALYGCGQVSLVYKVYL